MSLCAFYPLTTNFNNLVTSESLDVYNTTLTGTSGKFNVNCPLLNGSTSYLKNSNALSYFVNGEYSFSCWVKFSSFSAVQCIASCRTGVGNGFSMFLFSATSLRIDLPTTTTLQVYANPNLVANTWAHLVLTLNNTSAKFYVNGVLTGQWALTFTTDYISNILYLGAADSGGGIMSYFLSGSMQNVRIYDHTLSIKEIKELSKGLVAHYSFEDILNHTNNLFSGTDGLVGSLTIDYAYATDIFKDYGFDTAIKLIPNSITTQKYSYYMPVSPSIINTLGLDKTKIYSFVMYAYVSTDCDANFRLNLEKGATWVSNYKGTTSNVNDDTKGKVIKAWGKIKPNQTDGKMQFIIYPNPYLANTFTQGYQLIAGLEIYQGDFIVDPISNIDLYTENSNTVLDSSGFGYNGIINNLSFSDTSNIGKYSLYHDGTSYLNTLYTSFNPSFITKGAVCMWYKRDASSTSGYFLMASAETNTRWLYAATSGSSWNGGSTTSTGFYFDGARITNLGTAATDKNWHYYVANGVNLASWNSMYFNRHDNTWRYYGNISDIKIFTTELTEEEISYMYKSEMSLDSSGKLFAKGINEFPNLYIDFYNASSWQQQGWSGSLTIDTENKIYCNANNGWRVFSITIPDHLVGQDISYSFDYTVTNNTDVIYISIFNDTALGFGTTTTMVKALQYTTLNTKKHVSVTIPACKKYLWINLRKADINDGEVAQIILEKLNVGLTTNSTKKYKNGTYGSAYLIEGKSILQEYRNGESLLNEISED